MYRLPVCLLVSFTFNAVVCAQVRVGINAGVGRTFSSVEYAPQQYRATSVADRTAILIGGYGWIKLKEHLFFQPGFRLCKKGFKSTNHYDDGTSSSTITFDYPLTYIEVPLNLVYSSKAGGDGFQAGAGPVMSYLTTTHHFSAQPFRRPDYGVDLFAGYQFPLGFILSLSYTHGFSNAVQPPYYDFQQVKNRVLLISAGYLF